MAGGEEWVYVLSQQEAEAEQAVAADAITATATVTAAGEENSKPSKNPDDGETANAAAAEEEASAQPSESNKKAAQSSSSSKDGGGAPRSSSDDQDRREEEEDLACYTQEHDEKYPEHAKRVVLAAIDMLEALHRRREEEYEKEYALHARSSEAFDFEHAVKIDADAGATAASSDTGRGGRVTENPYYYDRYNSNDDDDTYGAEPYPYPYYGGLYGGSGRPGCLGLGGSGGYDHRYYDRYGFGFPGAYGAATGPGYGYGYGGNAGYYYGEPYPYTYAYVPAGYQTVVYQAPPPAFNASFFSPLQQRPSYFYQAPPPAPVSIRPDPRRRYSAPADEPSSSPPAAVAPTTQPPEPSSRH